MNGYPINRMWRWKLTR